MKLSIRSKTVSLCNTDENDDEDDGVADDAPKKNETAQSDLFVDGGTGIKGDETYFRMTSLNWNSFFLGSPASDTGAS